MKKYCTNPSKVFVIFLLCIFCSLSTTPNTIQADQDISLPSVKKIRVLLEEHTATNQTQFIVKSRHGFVLESPVDTNNTAVYKDKELRLVCKNKNLFLKCHDGQYKRIKYNSLEVCDPHNKLTIGGTTYQGSLIFRIDEKGKVLVINKLPLEDYIYSVVRSESIPSWPLGMQKIQAIISRTYAVYQMQQARLAGTYYRFYDIRNTNLHQVYNGTHTCTHLRQAVDETHDLILTYKNNIALTMFDICCGGVIPNLMRDKDTSKPYLCRKERCLYCTACPSYQWKEDVHEKTFLQLIQSAPHIKHKFKNFSGPITDIKVVDTDKAGLARKVKVFDKKKHAITLTGNELRRITPYKIKSVAFNAKKVRDRVLITGKGYGHQHGACQWGCKGLVDRGWSTKSILNFYYPGTRLSRLL